jgi:lactoylglutathione lyase
MPRFLHTCYRIGEIDRSVAFYEKLGFEERRRMPIGDEAINVFMGLPGEDPVLELTYNHGVTEYELGSGYNHIALLVDDLDGPRRPGHRAGKAPLPPRRPHRGPPHSVRPRPRRVPDRADRRVAQSCASP